MFENLRALGDDSQIHLSLGILLVGVKLRWCWRFAKVEIFQNFISHEKLHFFSTLTFLIFRNHRTPTCFKFQKFLPSYFYGTEIVWIISLADESERTSAESAGENWKFSLTWKIEKIMQHCNWILHVAVKLAI